MGGNRLSLPQYDARRPSWAARGVLLPVLCAIVALVAFAGPAAAEDGAQDPFVLHVPVLMYHRISAAPDDALLPDLWVTPARFEAQLSALKQRGWVTVTAREVAEHLRTRTPFGPRRFVISIDDGARDGWTHAIPVLRRLGMRATFFITPGRVGRAWQLTWPQLRVMTAEGHEIANHTLSHADLPALGPRALRYQIVRAQALIEQKVGLRPITFCYPFGDQSRTVREAVRDAGLRLAFTTVYGAEERSDRRFQTPRIRVHAGDSGADLVARLAPYRGVSGGSTASPSGLLAPAGRSMTAPPLTAIRSS